MKQVSIRDVVEMFEGQIDDIYVLDIDRDDPPKWVQVAIDTKWCKPSIGALDIRLENGQMFAIRVFELPKE